MDRLSISWPFVRRRVQARIAELVAARERAEELRRQAVEAVAASQQTVELSVDAPRLQA